MGVKWAVIGASIGRSSGIHGTYLGHAMDAHPKSSGRPSDAQWMSMCCMGRMAFDSVYRGVLIETMREREIREGIVRRVKGMLKETTSRGRNGKRLLDSTRSKAEVSDELLVIQHIF